MNLFLVGNPPGNFPGYLPTTVCIFVDNFDTALRTWDTTFASWIVSSVLNRMRARIRRVGIGLRELLVHHINWVHLFEVLCHFVALFGLFGIVQLVALFVFVGIVQLPLVERSVFCKSKTFVGCLHNFAFRDRDACTICSHQDVSAVDDLLPETSVPHVVSNWDQKCNEKEQRAKDAQELCCTVPVVAVVPRVGEEP